MDSYTFMLSDTEEEEEVVSREEWFHCLYAFKGKYVRRDHGPNPFILLEAVVSEVVIAKTMVASSHGSSGGWYRCVDGHGGYVIIKPRVKVNQKARILELKGRNHEEHCSDNLYVVSIKEDTAYPCFKLHLASTKERFIRRIQKKPYAIFKYKSWNILEYNNHRAHAKKTLIRHIEPFQYGVSTKFQTL
ncbi:hypothetical protein Tco_1045388 [Tanacetum coccineum]|uniref:Uncharacterized protein n=1 Tax=Tanacetum coccineum TaxID=301880 RepID=A0ABQ5GT08_9ASTR